jgi:hypothetical protein
MTRVIRLPGQSQRVCSERQDWTANGEEGGGNGASGVGYLTECEALKEPYRASRRVVGAPTPPSARILPVCGCEMLGWRVPFLTQLQGGVGDAGSRFVLVQNRAAIVDMPGSHARESSWIAVICCQGRAFAKGAQVAVTTTIKIAGSSGLGCFLRCWSLPRQGPLLTGRWVSGPGWEAAQPSLPLDRRSAFTVLEDRRLLTMFPERAPTL